MELMRQCPNCGKAVSADRTYCMHCGTTLGVKCEACGKVVPLQTKVCACGHSFVKRTKKVRSGKKLLIPVTVSSFLAVAALLFDMDKSAVSGVKVAEAVGSWLAFNLWFYVFLFPVVSFAPWERLRSKERKVKLKEKKK